MPFPLYCAFLTPPNLYFSVLGSVFTLIETIFRKICAQPLLKIAKRPFPVDARRSKTSNNTFAKSEYGKQNQENCNK